MSSYNRAILVGNLGKDPDIKHTQDGRMIVNLSIATSETWRDKSTGERKEKTEWHRVVVFNEGIAKVAEQYLRKGMKILVEGKIKTRKWTDQQGVERYSTEIVLENFDGKMQMLSGRDEGGGDDASERRSSGGGAAPRARQAQSDIDDEIPFDFGAGRARVRPLTLKLAA